MFPISVSAPRSAPGPPPQSVRRRRRRRRRAAEKPGAKVARKSPTPPGRYAGTTSVTSASGERIASTSTRRTSRTRR
eukprot:2647229-Prymnesium_polylepis.1